MLKGGLAWSRSLLWWETVLWAFLMTFSRVQTVVCWLISCVVTNGFLCFFRILSYSLCTLHTILYNNIIIMIIIVSPLLSLLLLLRLIRLEQCREVSMHRHLVIEFIWWPSRGVLTTIFKLTWVFSCCIGCFSPIPHENVETVVQVFFPGQIPAFNEPNSIEARKEIMKYSSSWTEAERDKMHVCRCDILQSSLFVPASWGTFKLQSPH